MSQPASVKITVQGIFAPATTWQSFGVDLSGVAALSFVRGMTDGGPQDRLAPTGTCRWDLKNAPDGETPGRAIGKYSLNSSNCATGFKRGMQIRAVHDYYARAVVIDGATEYWKLEEASGLTLVDAIGSRNATLSAATGYTYGIEGALNNATTGLGLAATIAPALFASTVSLPPPLSIEFWCKPVVPTNGDAYSTLIGTNLGSGVFMGASIDPGTVQFDFYDDSNPATPAISSVAIGAVSGGQAAGTLFHFVFTMSAGGVCKSYVNGVLVDTNTIVGAIGCQFKRLFTDTFSGHWQGPMECTLIDELSLYPVVLTPAKVLEHYLLSQPLWRGKLYSADPIPGTKGDRRVKCIARDCMADLAENDIITVDPQIDQTEVQLLTEMFTAIPTAAQPPGFDFDTALDSYPIAFDNLGGTAKGTTVVKAVIDSCQGFFYPKFNGYARYENRHSRSLLDSAFTFANGDLTSISVPGDLSKVYNHVRATQHPKTTGTSNVVLYSLPKPVEVQPGQIFELTGTYHDPTNTIKLVGGKLFVTPLVATTDYRANSSEDGTGTNLTAFASITANAYAAKVQFLIENTGTQPFWLADSSGNGALQLRGIAISDNAPTSVEKIVTMDYGDRLLPIDLSYQSDASVGQDLVDFLAAQYHDPTGQVFGIEFYPAAREAMMRQALTGEIGTIVTTNDTMTGIVSVEVAIQGIEFIVTPKINGSLVKVRYVTAPRGPSRLFVLDDPVLGLLDTGGVLAYA